MIPWLAFLTSVVVWSVCREGLYWIERELGGRDTKEDKR